MSSPSPRSLAKGGRPSQLHQQQQQLAACAANRSDAAAAAAAPAAGQSAAAEAPTNAAKCGRALEAASLTVPMHAVPTRSRPIIAAAASALAAGGTGASLGAAASGSPAASHADDMRAGAAAGGSAAAAAHANDGLDAAAEAASQLAAAHATMRGAVGIVAGETTQQPAAGSTDASSDGCCRDGSRPAGRSEKQDQLLHESSKPVAM